MSITQSLLTNKEPVPPITTESVDPEIVLPVPPIIWALLTNASTECPCPIVVTLEVFSPIKLLAPTTNVVSLPCFTSL